MPPGHMSLCPHASSHNHTGGSCYIILIPMHCTTPHHPLHHTSTLGPLQTSQQQAPLALWSVPPHPSLSRREGAGNKAGERGGSSGTLAAAAEGHWREQCLEWDCMGTVKSLGSHLQTAGHHLHSLCTDFVLPTIAVETRWERRSEHEKWEENGFILIPYFSKTLLWLRTMHLV